MAEPKVQVGKEIVEKVSTTVRAPLIEGLTAAASAIPFGGIFMDKFAKDTSLGQLIFSGGVDKPSENETQQTESLETIEENGGEVSKKLDVTNEYLKTMAEGVPTQEELEEAARAKAAEAGGEVAEPTKEEKEGFGMMLLKFLGLVLAAAAGLAVGAATGIVKYLTDIVKLIGKPIIKMLDAIPRPQFIDDIIDMFKAEGMVGKLFTKIKTFFTGEGTFFKRISGIIDTVTDVLKGYAGGLFTKIQTFFVGEGTFFKRIAGIIDPVIDTLKGFGGGLFTKVQNFFTGETSVFKRIATVLDPVIETVKGFSGGLFTKIQTFFTGETSVFKRISTLLDPIIETVKGFSGGLFTKIQNFFTGETGVFKRIGTVVDTVIDSVKGFGGKVFTTIQDIFSSVADVGKKLAAPFQGILDFFPGGKGEGGIISKILGFLSPFKAVFKAAASLGAKLVAPLNIIIGIFDAGFETKDAVEKSEGLFPSLLNGLIGAIGGFFDGAVLQLVDFLKDGVATVVGFFGFEGAEKALKDFSFSAKFNEFLDQIYSFVNNLFDFDLAAIANSIIPEDSFLRKFVPESLFQSADKAVEKTNGVGGDARGAVIVNRPSYLPSSGRVIGEAKTYTGRGLAYGGVRPGPIPLDGGPEAVIPLSGSQAQAFIEPVANAIAGQSLNQMAMDRVGMQNTVASAGPTIVDNSTNTQNYNETNVRSPSANSPHVYGEFSDRMIRMSNVG